MTTQRQTERGPDAASDREGQIALSLRDVECRYEETVVLTGVSFDVRRGEIFFIGGGSGCGKSTLLKNVIGLIHPAGGEVSFFGREMTSANPDQRREIQSMFGVLYQSAALWSSMTLAENIELPLEIFTDLTPAERRQVTAIKLAQVGLQGAEQRYPSELSGGMRKRAGLARALALDPPILFFDEPSAGLDPLTARKLDDLIGEIAATLGTTMIIVSHELESIHSIGDRIVILDKETKGAIALGKPRELAEQADHPAVREFLTRGGARPANRP